MLITDDESIAGGGKLSTEIGRSLKNRKKEAQPAKVSDGRDSVDATKKRFSR